MNRLLTLIFFSPLLTSSSIVLANSTLTTTPATNKTTPSYLAVTNIDSNIEAQQIISFLKRQLGIRSSCLSISNISKHSSIPNNYLVESSLKYSEKSTLRYSIFINRLPDNSFHISKQLPIDVPEYSAAKM